MSFKLPYQAPKNAGIFTKFDLKKNSMWTLRPLQGKSRPKTVDKDRIQGFTGNSVSAALPELALIFAGQGGASGRPLPALLQLPLESSLRRNLHELVAQN